MATREESRGNWWIRLRYQDFFGSQACGEMDGDQQAFYLLMIAAAARAGERGLPSDPKQLRKLLNVSLGLFRRSFSSVSEEFYERNGRLFHLIVDEELADAGKRSNRARAAIVKRWGDQTQLCDDTSSNTERDTTVIPSRTRPRVVCSSSSSSSLNPDEEKKDAGAERPRPEHPDDFDQETEARALFELWRDGVNPNEPQSSAMPTLRALLADGWSSSQLRTVIERKALEVKPEVARGIFSKVRNFFTNPDQWQELLRDDWSPPPNAPAHRLIPENVEVSRRFLERGKE